MTRQTYVVLLAFFLLVKATEGVLPRGLYPVDAYELQAAQFLAPSEAPKERTRVAHCISDMPGSLFWSGIMMAIGIGITIVAIIWLVHAASTTNDGSINQVAASPKKPNLDVLDGMRTLLVTYVVLMHYPTNLPYGLEKLIVMGWPMQFFFVLSGFILYYVYEDKYERFGFASGAKLITRRLVRLVPLYQVAIVVEYMTAVARGLNGRPFIAWPLHSLFLQTFFSFKVCGDMQPGKEWALNYLHFAQNGLGWFTAALIWMSCLFPFLYNIQRKAELGQTCAILFVIIVCRSIPEIMHPIWGHWGQGNMHLFVFLPLRLLEFVAGMLTAQAVKGLHPESSIRAMRGWGWIFDGLLLIGLVAVHWPVLADHEKTTYGVYYTGDFYVTALWCFVCAAARLATEQYTTSFLNGPLYWLISSWPLRSLAQYSFAAYILQSTVLTFWDPGFPWNLVIVWVIGFVATTVIERPLRKWVDCKLRTPSSNVKALG